MSVNYDDLIQKVIARAAELIQTGASTEQLGYLAKGLEILESVREKDVIADTIAQLGDINGKLIEAKQLLENTEVGKLGKPAVRLFGLGSAWDFNLPFGGTNFNNDQNYKPKLTYGLISSLKTQFKKSSFSLQLGVRNAFSYASQNISNSANNNTLAWSLYILKNTSKEDKQITVNTYLSSFSNWVPAYAWVISEGNVLLSRNTNTRTSNSFTITISAGKGVVIYTQNGSQNWGSIGNTNVYMHLLTHNVSFDLPEGVEWDYEKYAELIS